MGLLSGLMGNASEVEAGKLQTELAQVLAPDERVEKAYQLIRDMFVFTDKRLIFVNRQGLTGSKVEYQSIPTAASPDSASKRPERSTSMRS